LSRCDRGTVTILFAMMVPVLFALILACLELARLQRDTGRIVAGLTAAAEDAVRSLTRGIEGDDLQTRAQAMVLAQIPAGLHAGLTPVRIDVDGQTRRLVASTVWHADTAFGPRAHALWGDAAIPPVAKRRRTADGRSVAR
jgi:Flp pilus assembly protein TadG